ncbi:MAG: HEAT repeat domain-containing protein [Pyrinomonadaceae bacterium]
MLEQLIRDFPRSSWGDEARVMRTELAAQLGNRGVIEDALTKDNEEIKIVALQSLFRANPERALSYVADILKPNSTASRRMKEVAISLLGGRGNQQAVPLLLDIARSQPDVRLRQIAVFRLGEIGGESVLDELAKIYQSTPEVKVKQAVPLGLRRHEKSSCSSTDSRGRSKQR